MEEDVFSLEHIHRNLRWQYFSWLVSQYKSLTEFVGHEHLAFMANGNEIMHVAGREDFRILLLRLEFGTEERFYVMDDGNGYLRLSQFVKWHFKNGLSANIAPAPAPMSNSKPTANKSVFVDIAIFRIFENLSAST